MAMAALAVIACGPLAQHAAGSPVALSSPSPASSSSPQPLPTEPVATPGVGTAPPVGRWDVLPPMSTPRLDFTATLLPGGRVLIAGGRTNAFAYAPAGAPTSSVELFDPASRTLSKAASLGVARSGHTATLLASGKVLVAGGDGGGFGTAEIYDPAADAWTTTGAMNFLHTDHVAVLLGDGRVLVTGGGPTTIVGYGPQGSRTAKSPAELYNPTTDSWSIAATPAYDRPVKPTATLLKNGRVLVVGGQYMDASSDEALERSEIYDPTANTWSAATPETRAGARQFHTAAMLGNGDVVIAGGERDWSAVGFVSMYHPDSNSWTQLPNMHDNRCAPASALLASGMVLVVGGGCAGPDETATAEEFDPQSYRWYAVASLPSLRGSLQLVALQDGRVLGLGGMEEAGMPTALAEVFIPS
jgi:hypothetical protein